MQPSELLDVVNRLDVRGPIYLKLTVELRGIDGAQRVWYHSQKEHLQAWLGQYDGPGAYGRANWDRSAEFVYNHFQCVEGLVWLSEALDVDRKKILAACEKVRISGTRSATQCGVFRRHIPWRASKST